MSNIAPTHTLSATHCGLCRRPLTDVESVQIGIGPICSERYYDPSYTPTPEEVDNALAILYTLAQIKRVPESLVFEVEALKDQPRLAANKVVYWTSANYTDTPVVFEAARVLRAFGFTVFADKLEDDRTSVHLVDQGDEILIRSSCDPLNHKMRSFALSQECKGLYSRTETVVQKEAQSEVELLVSTHLAGRLGALRGRFFGGLQGVTTIPAAPPFAKATTCILQDTGTDVRVQCPYHGEWLADFKDQIPTRFRTWEAGSKTWKVPRAYLPTLIALADKYFGGSEFLTAGA